MSPPIELENKTIWSSWVLSIVNLSAFNSKSLNELVLERFGTLPDLILTSATSMPFLDMTERYIWQWGKENGIKTIGVLDQWQNYALRFSGAGEEERLAYMPDHIFVMDDFAKKEMVEEGIPKEKIMVTGQPAFSEVSNNQRQLQGQTNTIKKEIGIPDNAIVVTFVAEALKKDFADNLGYDEQSTLMFLGEVLEKTASNFIDREIFLIVKLHPENSQNEFDWVESKWPSLKKCFISNQSSPSEVISVSDFVMGMSSVFLVEAILAEKLVVSLQLNTQLKSQAIAARVGAIPFIRTIKDGEDIILSVLNDQEYRAKYLERQNEWKIEKNGAKNCVMAIKEILKK